MTSVTSPSVPSPEIECSSISTSYSKEEDRRATGAGKKRAFQNTGYPEPGGKRGPKARKIWHRPPDQTWSHCSITIQGPRPLSQHPMVPDPGIEGPRRSPHLVAQKRFIWTWQCPPPDLIQGEHDLGSPLQVRA